MRNLSLSALLFLLVACGGELSQQQRESIRNSMDDGQIRRMTPAQLTESGYRQGREIARLFDNDPNLANQKIKDSLRSKSGIRIAVIRPDSTTIAGRVAEAYAAAPDAADLSDNLQKIGIDTLLYTSPVSYDRPDGSRVFRHALAVFIPVRWLVRTSE